LKNARERMDALAAYREVGSYRGAAQICGTTHMTVRRIVGRIRRAAGLRSAKTGSGIAPGSVDSRGVNFRPRLRPACRASQTRSG
jgi:hypothetical protein